MVLLYQSCFNKTEYSRPQHKETSVNRRNFLMFFIHTILLNNELDIEERVGAKEFFEQCNNKLMIQTVRTVFAQRFNRYNFGALTIGIGLQGCNQVEKELSGIMSLFVVAGIFAAFISSVIFNDFPFEELEDEHRRGSTARAW